MIKRFIRWLHYRRWRIKINHAIEVLDSLNVIMKNKKYNRTTRRQFLNTLRHDPREAIRILKEVGDALDDK